MEAKDPTSQPVPTESSNTEKTNTESISPEDSLTNQAEGDEAKQSGEGDKQKKSEPPKRYEIVNKTPRRIAIKYTQSAPDKPEYLVIAPFSTKVLSAEAKKNYECELWEKEDLIDVHEIIDSPDDSLSGLGAGVGCGFFLVVYLVVAILIPVIRTSIYTWIIFGVLLLATVVLTVWSAGGFQEGGKGEGFGGIFKRFLRGILQVINLALFLLVVFGLGIVLFYMFSGGKDWVTTREFPMEGLGRVIQYLFLTIATMLPALMYFLFNRRQREKVQENFIREVLRLDPGVRTISEAESKYLALVQETFGTTHTSAFLLSSGLPILLCTLLIFMGWLLVLQPFAVSSIIDIQKLENLLLPRPNTVTFAFLGAYFFAVSLVFRRYVRADLTPKTYTHIILRLLLAIILAWTLSALPAFAEGGSTQAGDFSTGLLYLLAFFIGIFPETGVTVLQDLARNPLFTRMFPRLEEEHPLTRLDGINLYDRSRLLEEGIENIENLAHHNLISLMLSTRISTNRLVDMFDQAILYLHLGLDPDEVAEARKKLRAYGIRTATDLEAAHKAAEERKNSDEFNKFLMILNDENAQPESLSKIQTILDTLRDDDWMNYLRNWRELTQRSLQYFTLKGITLVPLEDRVQQDLEMAY